MPTTTIDQTTAVAYAQGLLAQTDLISEPVEQFSLPGLRVSAQVASVGYAQLCRRALVDDPAYADAPRRPLAVSIFDHASRPDLPRARWSSPSFGMGEFVQCLEANGLSGAFDTEHAIWHFHSAALARGVQAMLAPDQFAPWEASFPLRNFLHWGYQAQGMRLVHAGTLGKDGRGVMLAGAGGSGKSGTTLAGICNGLASVGDDYVAVGMTDGQPTSYPVMKLMKQDPKGLARLGIDPIERGLGHVNWQNKYEFDYDELQPGARAKSLALCGILMPRISDLSRSRISPAPMREALYGLLPNNLQQLPGGLRQGLSFVTALTKALPAYYIELSADPLDISDTISAFLEGNLP